MRSFFNKEKEHELKPCTKIVVASGSSSAGISFVSEIIALGLHKIGSVSLVELGKPYFYNAYNFEKAFFSRGFNDFFEKIRKGERINNLERNEFEKVNWLVRKPEDLEKLSPQQLFRSLYAPKDEYCVFDCSGLDMESSINLLAEADIPIAVIDPLPTKLIESRDFLEKLKISLPNAILLVNKMNIGVHRAELIRYLGTKEFFSMPSVPMEYIYKAEYNCLPISGLSETRQILGNAQDMLYRLFQ